ncbi:MAG: RluA family pseudouridine synthase [Minisyncoccia bacterium]|jgi:23S rRNA pseudouridine1911/1915/1917 synthase
MSNTFPYEIDVLYEDADCAVLDKPAGLMVHPDGRSAGPFLTDWIAERYPRILDVGEPMKSPDGKTLMRPGIVHRLDRDTSGAIVIAKTPEAHAFLKEQFRSRSVLKKYLAFVWGEMKEEFGTIDRPMGRSGSDFRKWSAQRGARGGIREAETYWTRLWTGEAEDDAGRAERFTLVQAEPKTGRTHQIRAHLQAIQHPVVGDALYAPKKPPALGFKRAALHARSIEFESREGKRIKATAPLPDDFKEAFRVLGIKNLES